MANNNPKNKGSKPGANQDHADGIPTAAIYLRTATRPQHGDRVVDHALAAQRQACFVAATMAGALVTDEFADHGCSGARIEGRPQLSYLIHHIEKHKPSFVVVADRSRLCRNRKDSQVILHRLKKAGVKLLVADEPSGDKMGPEQADALFRELQRQVTVIERRLDEDDSQSERPPKAVMYTRVDHPDQITGALHASHRSTE